MFSDMDVTTIVQETKTFRKLEGEEKEKAVGKAALTVLQSIQEAREVAPKGHFSKM